MSTTTQPKQAKKNNRFLKQASQLIQRRGRLSKNSKKVFVQHNSIVKDENLHIEKMQNQDLQNNPPIKKEELSIQQAALTVKMEKKEIYYQPNNESQSDNPNQREIIVGKTRKNHSKKAQNLKNISSLIRILIGNNQNLTVKSLSYLLYEIIGQTKFGLEILDCKYPMITQQTHKDLQKKYLNERNAEFQAKMLVRNVRRRLYDALNVMIAASVIYKASNILRMSSKLSQTTYNEEKKETKMEDCHNWEQRTLLEKLKLQFRQRSQRIDEKQKAIDELKKKIHHTKKLIRRNFKNKTAKNQRLNFPMLIIKQQHKIYLDSYEDVTIITGKRPIKKFGDEEILQLIFGKNTYPYTKFDA